MTAASAIALASIGCGGSQAASGPDAAAGSDAATASEAGAGDAQRMDGSMDAPVLTGGDAIAPASVGAPCIPSAEYSASFSGFHAGEVTLDDGNPACGAATCLVNHFVGRVTCPYGQSEDGGAPPGAPSCTVPGSSTPVAPNDPRSGDTVQPQCTDRTGAAAVICSCRCANAEGKTDDGASYCACPAGLTCSQVVPLVVSGDPSAGAYCIPKGTAFDPNDFCGNTCFAPRADCPEADAGALGTGAAPRATTYVLTLIQGLSRLCSPWAFPTDATGMAQCQIYYVLMSPGDTCAAHPGLANPDPLVAGTVQHAVVVAGAPASPPPPVCLVPQIAAPCASSTQFGWCYVTGANAPSGCAQSADVSPSAMPPAGATAVLACP
jgi:hypothetical protein